MKKGDLKFVIKLILIFTVMSYVLDKMVYFAISNVDKHVFTGQNTGKLNQFLQVKDSLDFITFGSSRANHNVKVDAISENSFNIGVDGQKIAFSATLIKTLPKKKQTLLVHIDPAFAIDSSYSARDLKSLDVKYHENSVIKNELDRLDQANPIQKFYWSVAFSGKLLGILKNFLRPKYDYRDYKGFDPIEVDEVQNRVFRNLRANRKDDSCPTQPIRMNRIYDSYLDELMTFSKINRKTLIFYTSPEIDDSCKEDNVFLKKKMKEKDIAYFDFTDLYADKVDYSDWKDFTHLSRKGAEKFTKDIDSIIFGGGARKE